MARTAPAGRRRTGRRGVRPDRHRTVGGADVRRRVRRGSRGQGGGAGGASGPRGWGRGGGGWAATTVSWASCHTSCVVDALTIYRVVSGGKRSATELSHAAVRFRLHRPTSGGRRPCCCPRTSRSG